MTKKKHTDKDKQFRLALLYMTCDALSDVFWRIHPKPPEDDYNSIGWHYDFERFDEEAIKIAKPILLAGLILPLKKERLLPRNAPKWIYKRKAKKHASNIPGEVSVETKQSFLYSVVEDIRRESRYLEPSPEYIAGLVVSVLSANESTIKHYAREMKEREDLLGMLKQSIKSKKELDKEEKKFLAEVKKYQEELHSKK